MAGAGRAAVKTAGGPSSPGAVKPAGSATTGAGPAAPSPPGGGAPSATGGQGPAGRRPGPTPRGAKTTASSTGSGRSSPGSGSVLPSSAGDAVDTGAGFILATVFWCLVGLPFLSGGLAGVKNMLKAKFLNKAPDGSWLP